MSENYIGDGEKAEVYVLNLDSYLRYMKPAEFGLPSAVPTINPFDYFITSGDAIKKTIMLRSDLISTISRVLSLYTDALRYKLALTTLLSSIDKLLSDLEFARGDALFLETEWYDHVLFVVPKNPRVK